MSSLTPKHDIEACRSAGDCYRTTLNNLKALLKEVEECDRQTKTGKNKCCSETFPPDWSIPVITYPITPQREKEYFMNLKMPWERQHSQIIAGKYYICSCVKRDGLQADCPLVGCQGSELCLTKPYPICPPSGNAETKVTPEMAECLLGGLRPNNPNLEVTECKENEPCNVKCAECNASLQNICKWNPDFFNSAGNANNDARIPAPPTKDTVPGKPIVSNDKVIDPSLAKITFQFRMAGLDNGMNNQNMADPCNGMINQNIIADPCNDMNGKKTPVQYNGINNQNNMADPCNPCIGTNSNKIAVQYNVINNQNKADLNSQNMRVPYNGTNQNNMVGLSTKNNVRDNTFDLCNGMNKTADPGIRSNNQNYVVAPNNVASKSNKMDYFNKTVEMCSRVHNMDNQSNGMNKNKVVAPGNGRNNIKMVDPCSGTNNQNNVVVPNNVANQKNGYNKIVEICSRVHYNMPSQNNGMNNNRVVDPCNGMNNQNNMTNQTNQMRNNINMNIPAQNNGMNNRVVDPCKGMNNLNNMTNQTNQMNSYRVVDQCNGMNNGKPVNIGTNSYKTGDTSNVVDNQNNMVVPFNPTSQNNTPTPYNPGKKTEPCSKMVLKFTMVDPTKTSNAKLANQCNGENSNKMTNPCNGMNNQNRMPVQSNGLNNNGKIAVQNKGMNQNMMADPCNRVNNGKIAGQYNEMNNYMANQSNVMNNYMANQSNVMNNNYMANQSNVMNNNMMPIKYNGLNNPNTMAVPTNGNQPSYMYNCSPCSTNPNLFWCTLQK
ncbi:putative uncharacterized protein DDB_G0286901 [Cimex lectularius]|uniref:Uncharacterized protein n=1 Tax=Cimex lectularius TaxID=79782 RepID=A0A8I6S2A4_CIMLE|nr:putative uncharacterized protein DDB_G0286901 [Cimex lectularius]